MGLALTLTLTLIRYMAVAYTLKHPTRVASLVLVSPAGLSGSPHESRQVG